MRLIFRALRERVLLGPVWKKFQLTAAQKTSTNFSDERIELTVLAYGFDSLAETSTPLNKSVWPL